MTATQAYYRHARSLGAFRAVDALAMARQAAELDRKATFDKLPTFVDVGMIDGCKLSQAIRVY